MKRLISVALIAVILLAGIGVAAAQYQGGMQQGGGQQGGAQTLNIPPAPEKAKANMQYGNTARAAIIGERLSDAAEDNANVYITENADVTASVYLQKDASPYDIAGTMANLTYMIADLYGTMTEKSNSNILLKVYDASNNVIIDAKFNTAKNAFDYFNVPEGAAPSQRQQQPAARQPAAGQQQYGAQPYGTGLTR